jgi:S-formylglutathione hydrolase FrmB
MALLSVQFPSPALGKQAAMYVILPPGKGPFPALYLLHGLSDDYTIWQRRTSIERYVEGRNLIVVMPDGARSFYCNDPRPGGAAYEDHIIKDVVGFIDTTFHAIPDRRARAIAGLSMGGYGTMMLAMKHPDMFSAACAHSSAVDFAHSFDPDRERINIIAGNMPKDGRYDLYLLAQKVVKARKHIALRMDCGRSDGLLKENRLFHAYLRKIGFKHKYREYPGTHNWAYWDVHIQESLAFILSHLKGKKHLR